MVEGKAEGIDRLNGVLDAVEALQESVKHVSNTVEELEQHMKDSTLQFEYLNERIHTSAKHHNKLDNKFRKLQEHVYSFHPPVYNCQHCGGRVNPIDKKCGRCSKDHGVKL